MTATVIDTAGDLAPGAAVGVGESGRPAAAETGKLNCYLPRVLLERLVSAPDATVLTEDGTVVFVDISGFTALSERLARSGREGAEQLTDTISACFSTLLAEAYAAGGSLLKFGGDALLLWFAGEEHAQRACASAVSMRAALRRIGRVRAGSSAVVLRMSVGVHSGAFHAYLVGGSHREYLLAGPAASTVVALEAEASSGQILISAQTAGQLPARCLGARRGAGTLLARAPSARPWLLTAASVLPSDREVAACLSTAVRAHLQAGPALPEHRSATVSFLQFGGVDAVIEVAGPNAAAQAIEEVVVAAQEAADRYEICLLGSDIAGDGGKLLFSAGAPRALLDDEERMLLAMRHVVEAQTGLPVRAGVNRGYVFSGEVGPHYRRTYTLMGDGVNLAARLAANAPWGSIYATDSVLQRSRRRFELVAVPPFMVKGKARPVEAFTVGEASRAALAHSRAQQLPLVGRDPEVSAIRDALTAAAGGRGTLLELVDETGATAARLAVEARELAHDMRAIHAMCESYTQAVPYIAWRELLRPLLGLGWDDSDASALEALRAEVSSNDPELEPWIPLLGIALGVEVPNTREVEELAADMRAAKLHEAVIRLLSPALAVPTVVLIEHVNLMDEASAALLGALADHLDDSAWVVLVTRRELGAGFAAPPRALTRLEIGPLGRDAALALADGTPEAMVLPPHTIALAVERAAGNPEYLLDLLAGAAAGSGELPDGIEAAASARIDMLDPADRALVRRAAVLGLRFRATRLRHVLDGDAAEPDDETLMRLSDSLAPDADGYLQFKSPVLCEAAYAGLPFGLRRALHAAVGDALERDLGRDVDADPAVLSLHFSRAGDQDRAWRYALMGAERASARFALADAVRLYRLALDAHRGASAGSQQLAEVWEALGEALMQLGEIPAAQRALDAARRLIAGEPVAEARICFRRGQIAERGELHNAVRWMRRGLRNLEHVPGPDARRWRARLIADLAWIRQRQRRYREAERLCREALAEGEAVGELRAQARACYTLDWALFELGRSDEAGYSARALEIYRELGDPEHEARVLNNLGGLAYWGGRWQEAIDLYERAGECSERAGHAADRAFTDGNVGEILADQGRLEDAAKHLRRAHRVWSATGDRQGSAFANMLLGRVAARDGRVEEGIALLEAAVADMKRFRVDFYEDLAHGLIAEAEALGGDPRRALELAAERLEAGSSCVSLLRRVRGIAAARLEDLESATHELELALVAARERGEDFDVALALDAHAALGGVPPDALVERDAILERLGVVALPAIAGLARDARGVQQFGPAASG